jgi:hypothetical protein
LVLVMVAAVACSRTRVKPLRLEITRSDEAVDFTASERFAGIACSIYHWAQAEGGGPEALRYIWRAHCPGRVDCATVVRYGDARLQSEMQPLPLSPSEPGECYLCSVRSDRGRGTVRFTIEPDGRIADCPNRQ